MKTFPAAFTIEKNKQTGAKPVWIARLIAPDADYYLAGKQIHIQGFVGSSVWPASTPVNTVAWVSSFGNIVEGINGAIDEFKVSEMSISTIIDPETTINIETLVLAGIEGCIVELYEWFVDCSDPPQRIFVGKVRAVTDYNDTTITFAIQDETIDLEKFYIGDKIDLIRFPNALPADIGKILPIPFGVVHKVPAVCVATNGGYEYCYSNRSVTVTGVWARNTGIADINILPYCALYESSGVLIIYTSAALEIRKLITAQISLTDNGHAHSIGSADLNVSQNTTNSVPDISYAGTFFAFNFDTVVGTRTKISYLANVKIQDFKGNSTGDIHLYNNGSCIQTINVSSIDTTLNQNTTANLPVEINGSLTGDVTFNFDNVVGTRTRIDYSITATLNALDTFGSPHINIYINGISVGSVDISGWTVGTSRTFTGSITGNLDRNFIVVGTSFLSIQVTAVSRTVYYKYNDNYFDVAVDITNDLNHDSISVESSSCDINIATVSRIVYYTDNAAANTNITGIVNTYTQPAVEIPSEMILVDLIADCGNPTDAGSYILNLAGKSDITIAGTLPVSSSNGLINEYQTATFWLNKMAFEYGSWFVFNDGLSYFVSKLGSSSFKEISACQIDNNGKRILSRIKTDINDLINNITILYNRDWSQSESDKAYYQSLKVTYGDALHERPILFRFYFINDYASISALAILYLFLYQTQKWIITSNFFLDQSELEFGDRVYLSFIDKQGIIISAEHAPGNYNSIHQITLKVLI